jgi:hypothetical protein
MDYEKLNPCQYERAVRLLDWAETGCWCCTSLRALLVGLWVGMTIGTLIAGKVALAAVVWIVGAIIVCPALIIARRIWKDSYESAESEEQPK